ncbi:galectin-7-like isoform X1 [Rhynchophorus ferrugineus]|uniref:galectin-7-like isoform X1 n=1 Tax=Rhynchophorus ferrugineus TaxID=354439 RepID=UPI003FCC6B91
MAHLSPIPGGLRPGLSIRVRGQAIPAGDRFAINLQSGPASDSATIALHFSVRLNQGYVARNSKRHGTWEQEIGDGPLLIHKGQPFDILIRVDPDRYVVEINGQFFCDFPHRIPFTTVDHIQVNGDVRVSGVTFETRAHGVGAGFHNVTHTTYRNF